MSEKESSFLRGVGGDLDLFGVGSKEDLDFTYNGKDLREESTGEAFSSAWGKMGSLMEMFLDNHPDPGSKSTKD